MEVRGLTAPAAHPSVFTNQPNHRGPPSRGRLDVRVVAGASAVTAVSAASPLKLLTPRARGPSVWAYTSSFGGGLVAGDQIQLELEVDARARCFLGTQSSTKIYRNPAGRPCSQELAGRLGRDSFAAVLPDPIQCFAGASFVQRQTFRLAPGASLVLLDWMTGGRTARGERWAFSRYASRNEIVIEDAQGASSRLFLDALVLEGNGAGPSLERRLGRFNCLGLLVLIGPLLTQAAAGLLARVAALSVPRRSALLQSASPLGNGGALLRFAGEHPANVARALQHHLSFLPSLLGEDPWSRRW